MRFRLFLLIAWLIGLKQLNAQTLTSSDLPIVLINTNGQSIQNNLKIRVNIGIVFNGEGVRNRITDQPLHYNGGAGMEIRGQSSSGFPMNSYNIELQDAAGNDLNQSLFGMPEDSDWVLYAPYTDKTLMHNVLAYTLSRSMGHWAPRCRYVELVINGSYRGIYVLMEKIKRTNGRLSLATLQNTDNQNDELTGGYIFSIDKEPNGWFSSVPVPNATDGGVRQWSYVYPKPDSITNPQQQYLKSIVDAFEQKAASPDRDDPENGLGKIIDYGSFADYHIIDELSKNVDGYRLSTYFHKDKDSRNSKIKAGPVWDFDIAFRNANYCDGNNTVGWALDFNEVCPGQAAGLIPRFWYDIVREDSIFSDTLYCHWNALRQSVLHETNLFRIIDSISTLTAEARTRHFVRWPILGIYVWPNPQPIPPDYPAEIASLKNWLQQRLRWLDNNMPQQGNCKPYVRDGQFDVAIYPNPLPNEGTLQITSAISQRLVITVYTMHGQAIWQTKPVVNTGVFTLSTIPWSRWTKGMYLLQVCGEDGQRKSIKVIK